MFETNRKFWGVRAIVFHAYSRDTFAVAVAVAELEKTRRNKED